MADYDSASSSDDDLSGVSTNVLLGYTSTEATDDSINQLGGAPSWLDHEQPPSTALAQCRICKSVMVLLLQLNGALPERFPGHERRLYIWMCRRKACRRKDGSVRAVRALRITSSIAEAERHVEKDLQMHEEISRNGRIPESEPNQNIGAALFGGSGMSMGNMNPFSQPSSPNRAYSASDSNTPTYPGTEQTSSPPAAPSSPSRKSPSPVTNIPHSESENTDLPQTFAEKARISVSPVSNSKPEQSSNIPWPKTSDLPKAYPQYYLDADYEYLSPAKPSKTVPSSSHAAFMDMDDKPSSGNDITSGADTGKEDSYLYESDYDKTFQHFCEVIAQNPEQVLRYDFGGQPLLYSHSDAVGKLFSPTAASQKSDVGVNAAPQNGSEVSKIPRCSSCGAARVFELQLTPNAISELESDLDVKTVLSEGMEWGTIVLGVCSKDCSARSGGEEADGKVRYFEEWVGVQWEELVARGGR